jgi:S1-C subfamily serine protease
MRRVWLAGAIAVLVSGVLGGAVGARLERGTSTEATTTTVVASGAEFSTEAPPALSPAEIYKDAAAGVVVITDTQTQVIPSTFFTPSQRRQVGALGSGFVIDRQGDIVTNQHVVAGASSIRVGFSGGASYPAKIVAADPSTDIAVVRVHASPSQLDPLVFGDSSNVAVGDSVYAIGNPFGLDRTMTAGIVSATGRDITAPDDLTIPNAIQTDAAINHGNSGGPLLDRAGHVVGVDAQIEGGTVDANVGIGFAIAGNTAREVAAQLIEHGHAQHPWLGVRVVTLDPSLAKVVKGLPESGVVIVRVVAGSPAAKAGLVAARRQVVVGGVSGVIGGDTIVGVDGRSISSSAELADAVASHQPGDRLHLVVVRGGVRRTVVVTLGDVPK